MAIDPRIISVFGQPPDNINLNESIVVRYNIVTATIYGLAVAIVILRIFVRITRSSLWYDDYAIVLGTVFSTSMVIMTVLSGKHGAGEHIWANTLDRFIGLLKIVYAEPYVYALSVTTVKVSVLLLYRRIFTTKVDGFRVYDFMFYFGCFLTGSYPPILWITMACACKPVSYYWNQYLGATGTCINVEEFFLALGIVNMINDIILLIVPIPGIVTLNLNKKTKASIVGIMMLGGIVCIASVFRIYYLNGLFKNVDASWWMGPSFAWSAIEPLVAIISACLPTLAPLFRLRSKNSSGFSGSGGNPNTPRTRINQPRSNQGHFRFEDDEVELTCTVGANDSSHTNHLATNKGSSIDDEMEENTITVKTQISVVAGTKSERRRSETYY